MRTKQLFEHVFENGNRVEVTNKGVTIWDARVGRWIVDASCIDEDLEFSLSAEIYRRAKLKKYNPVFPAHYKIKKPRRKK